MDGIKLKRVEFTGVEEKKLVDMEDKCLKVLVKNLTDADIYVGIGSEDKVTLDNSVLIKSNCYQIVLINESEACCCLFDLLTINGAGFGTVECIQILY